MGELALRRALAAAAILIASACGEQETETSAPAPAPAASPAPAQPRRVREAPLAKFDVLDAPVTAPPESLRLVSYYGKYTDAAGIPVVSSAKVSDEALLVARTTILRMLVKRADVKKAIVAAGARVVILPRDERIPDVPELRGIEREAPKAGGTWAAYTGIFSSRTWPPVCVCMEKNVLREDSDGVVGDNILVHEMAHTIDRVALRRLPGSTFARDLAAAYSRAMKAGLWQKTYAATDQEEYWAVGAEIWFDAHNHAAIAASTDHEIRTRDQLRAYDLALYNLLSDVFPSDDLGLSTGK